MVCSIKFKKRDPDKFWNSLDKSGDCWIWKKCKTKSQYGRAIYGGLGYPAHRLAYILAKGPIPKGLFVCHKCDVPACCNPEHLFLGTTKDNIRDMISKGRAAWQKPDWVKPEWMYPKKAH